MTNRRSFLKGLVTLPLLGVAKAEPPETEPEDNTEVICPHCWEWTKREHMCEEYALWLEENDQ